MTVRRMHVSLVLVRSTYLIFMSDVKPHRLENKMARTGTVYRKSVAEELTAFCTRQYHTPPFLVVAAKNFGALPFRASV